MEALTNINLKKNVVCTLQIISKKFIIYIALSELDKRHNIFFLNSYIFIEIYLY